jgi:hypothetical protein
VQTGTTEARRHCQALCWPRVMQSDRGSDSWVGLRSGRENGAGHGGSDCREELNIFNAAEIDAFPPGLHDASVPPGAIA